MSNSNVMEILDTLDNLMKNLTSLIFRQSEIKDEILFAFDNIIKKLPILHVLSYQK